MPDYAWITPIVGGSLLIRCRYCYSSATHMYRDYWNDARGVCSEHVAGIELGHGDFARHGEMTCDNCNRTCPVGPYDVPGSHLWLAALGNVCGGCRMDHYNTCTECGKWYDCRTSTQCCVRPPSCQYCGNRSRIVPDFEIHGMTVSGWCRTCCDDRYPTCVECSDRYHIHNMIRIRTNGDLVCSSCIESSDTYFNCSDHPGSYYSDQEYDPTEDGLPCCEEARRERYSSAIQPWNYRPTLKFHGDSSKLYLGMEIEVNCDNVHRTVETAIDGFNDLVYLKEDGSIGSSGVEMVTHPMTHDWAMGNFPWHTLTDLAKVGTYAADSCGIHVHASRDGFSSPAHEMRWMTFFERNEAGVTTIARRVSAQWAGFGHKTPADRKMIATKKNYCGTCYQCGRGAGGRRYCERATSGMSHRYQAINPTNEHTYEVRVFASSLDIVQVKAALDLVHSTIEYARQMRAVDFVKSSGWAWSTYTNWLTTRTEYPSLISELIRLNAMEA